MMHKSIARKGALLFGIVYVVVGLAGFAVTGFDDWLVNTNEVLIIFEVNAFHNVVHLALGALFLAAYAVPDEGVAQGINAGIGFFLILAAVIGFAGTGALQLISIDSALAADNFLHLFGGIAAVVLGFQRLTTATAATA